MNLNKDTLHQHTKDSLGETLGIFPSKNVYHNNLAQAIEILHSVDDSIELLNTYEIKPEPLIKKDPIEAIGVGVVEAPRGTLFHKIHVGSDGVVKGGEIVVQGFPKEITKSPKSYTGKFLKQLVKNIKLALGSADFEYESVKRISGRILIKLKSSRGQPSGKFTEGCPPQIKKTLTNVFGITNFSFAEQCKQNKFEKLDGKQFVNCFF